MKKMCHPGMPLGRDLSRAMIIFIFFLASFSTLSFSATDTGEISVKAEVDRAFITIGQPVQYTVTVRHDPSIKVMSSIPPPDADILKIKKVEDIKRQEDDFIVEGRKYTLTAFSLGDFVLDPVEIKYQKGNEPPKAITTEKIYLKVKSVALGEEKTDIRGTKSVVDLPKNFLLLIILIVLAALAGAGFIAYRFFRKPAGPAAPLEPVLSPEEEALAHLNQLFDSDLIRRGKVKEYYLKFSEILRHYLERRFHILAIESTTDEIIAALRRKEVDQSLRTILREVLEAADLAKFAKWTPEPPQIVLLNQKAKQFIEMARPKEVVSGV